jgi:hypothetical protein
LSKNNFKVEIVNTQKEGWFSMVKKFNKFLGKNLGKNSSLYFLEEKNFQTMKKL